VVGAGRPLNVDLLATMATIPELLAQVEAKGHEVWSAGPQSQAAIAALESKLGVRLPPSYRAFVAQYGGMAIYDSTISGIIGGEPLDEGRRIALRRHAEVPHRLGSSGPIVGDPTPRRRAVLPRHA
jgi:hypothetical protein